MITITTDFGYEDHYAGVMKGVIKKINPKAEIVDITHGIKRHDIRHGSYVLRSIIDYFPAGTVHLLVIDPGVGTARRGIVAELDAGYFVGPDNGLLSLVKNRVRKVYKITKRAEKATFHGRDIFAPIAAKIDQGIFDELEQVENFETYTIQGPRRTNNEIIGEIIHVDHFGNVITNIPKNLVGRVSKIEFEDNIIKFVASYGHAKEKELISLINSEDLLELAVNKGSAKDVLAIKTGDRIKIKIID